MRIARPIGSASRADGRARRRARDRAGSRRRSVRVHSVGGLRRAFTATIATNGAWSHIAIARRRSRRSAEGRLERRRRRPNRSARATMLSRRDRAVARQRARDLSIARRRATSATGDRHDDRRRTHARHRGSDGNGTDDDHRRPAWRVAQRVDVHAERPVARWSRSTLDDGGMAAAGCTAADFNGDGRIDIACIGTATANLKWYESLRP